MKWVVIVWSSRYLQFDLLFQQASVCYLKTLRYYKSNWTFIALNLTFTRDCKVQHNQNGIFIASNSLTLSLQVLGWFCGAKCINRQELLKEIFLSPEVTPCLRMSAHAQYLSTDYCWELFIIFLVVGATHHFSWDHRCTEEIYEDLKHTPICGHLLFDWYYHYSASLVVKRNRIRSSMHRWRTLKFEACTRLWSPIFLTGTTTNSAFLVAKRVK